MASLTQWTWVWASFGRWWWTGKPSALQSMGSQRVGHNWVSEPQHGILQARITHCRGLPFPSPGYLPNPGVQPGYPLLQADSLPFEPPKKAEQQWQCVVGNIRSGYLHGAVAPTWWSLAGCRVIKVHLYWRGLTITTLTQLSVFTSPTAGQTYPVMQDEGPASHAEKWPSLSWM